MKASKQTRREARQLLRLCYTNGLLDAGRAERLVQRVLQTRPRGYLPMLAHFQRLVRLEQARHAAKVETAVALTPDLSTGIQARLEGLYGPGLTVSFVQNPALIGGMRITVGSDVYDGSVQGRLTALQERFA